MATKSSKYGKVSFYAMVAEQVRMDVANIYELYNFSTDYYAEERSRLAKSSSRHPALPDEYWADETHRLSVIRRQFGYAVAILLSSAIEDGLKRLIARLEHDDPSAGTKFSHTYASMRGKNFLEKYALFHRDNFGTDFWTGISPLARKGNLSWLPDELDMDIGTIDLTLLLDFVWARNKIVHHSGELRTRQPLDQERRRQVPVEELLDKRSRIAVQKEYIERVTQHSIAFFDRTIADLRSRYD